jgi:hypothetical protein
MATEQEVKELEQEMKKMNVSFVPKSEMENKGVKNWLAVEVDIDCELDIEFMKDYVLKKKVYRGSEYFVVFEHSLKDKLQMRIGVELPEDYHRIYAKTIQASVHDIIATTFPDLCWIHSEGTTEKTLHEVSTKLRDNALKGDLTWVLPSKFVDDFVEMMHTLNLSIISGLMQDAIVYGPYIYKNGKSHSTI